jgi:hypothetical protein
LLSQLSGKGWVPGPLQPPAFPLRFADVLILTFRRQFGTGLLGFGFEQLLEFFLAIHGVLPDVQARMIPA